MNNKPEVLYFGCIARAGHYLHSRPWRPANLKETPWGYDLDDRVPKNELIQKDGWTAYSIVDNSVDTRPGSNSAFVARAILTKDELFELAQNQWPDVFVRAGFHLHLKESSK